MMQGQVQRSTQPADYREIQLDSPEGWRKMKFIATRKFRMDIRAGAFNLKTLERRS